MTDTKTTVEISTIKLTKLKIIALREGKTFKNIYTNMFDRKISEFEKKNGPIQVV